MYTPFLKSDWIDDMDHIRISGIEPSSVILSQTSSLKSWKVMTKKWLNKLKPKRDGVINQQNYKIYVQFDGMVYQQIVRIPMGSNWAPLIADLFLYCYKRDFMSNLRKSKRFDLLDKFNDTSRYLDDILTIHNTAFAEHIPDIYPR